MKRMKNLATVFLTISIALMACKKYDDGPTLSLRTKKARVVGEWKLSKMNLVETQIDNNGDKTETKTETTDGSKVTFTQTTTPSGSSSSSTSTNGTISMSLTTKRDGTYTSKTVTNFVYESVILGVTYTNDATEESLEEGTWNFAGGLGDAQNKEQIIFRPTKKTVTTTNIETSIVVPTSTSINTTTTEIDGEASMYTIRLLKNKEMRLLRNQVNNVTYTSGSSSNTNKVTTTSDLTLIQ